MVPIVLTCECQGVYLPTKGIEKNDLRWFSDVTAWKQLLFWLYFQDKHFFRSKAVSQHVERSTGGHF